MHRRMSPVSRSRHGGKSQKIRMAADLKTAASYHPLFCKISFSSSTLRFLHIFSEKMLYIYLGRNPFIYQRRDYWMLAQRLCWWHGQSPSEGQHFLPCLVLYLSSSSPSLSPSSWVSRLLSEGLFQFLECFGSQDILIFISSRAILSWCWKDCDALGLASSPHQ